VKRDLKCWRKICAGTTWILPTTNGTSICGDTGLCRIPDFGLGFERMLMFITGASNIRESFPFARTPGSAEF